LTCVSKAAVRWLWHARVVVWAGRAEEAQVVCALTRWETGREPVQEQML